VTAAREARGREREPAKDFDAGAAARRTLGVAAGAALVIGSVVAGAFGFTHSPDTTPSASGEPVGTAPGRGAPAAPNEAAAPQTQAPEFTNIAATEGLTQPAAAPDGRIGTPAKVAPPKAAPAPKPAAPAVPAPPPAAPAAPSAPSAGPVQTLTEPVASTVGGSTLSNTLAPVTQTVDNTLQPALSLIGGLLGAGR
jgi:hypothetical protein